MDHFAHSGRRPDRSDWEPLPDHLRDVAEGAAAAAATAGLTALARLAGALHDLGKFDPAFLARLSGQNVRVDHSTAGGAVLMRAAAGRAPGERLAAELIAYAVLGHHAGLPDMLSDGGAGLLRRLQGWSDTLAPEAARPVPGDLAQAMAELQSKVRFRDPTRSAFDLSLAARMIFSCLVDADFKATEAFYARLDGPGPGGERSCDDAGVPDRSWPDLQSNLDAHLAALDRRLSGFDATAGVNRLRHGIMAHVRARAALPPGPFTLTVPTGGGKTLASLGFALEHARRHGHRRIIYVIPYTSIIDQTAAEFRALLGREHVLEHHAAIETDAAPDPDGMRQGRDKLRLAMEDWAAPVVVTTAVQFFESLFASRTSRARKLHNIAGSVVILDEAQTLPRDLLAPCLRMLDGLTAHYGVSAVLCTATQPALDEKLRGQSSVNGTLIQTTFGLALADRELAPDPRALNRAFRRTTIRHGGRMDDAALVDALADAPQSLVVVNSRHHALKLYRAASHLGGVIHLTTRQHAKDRRRIIDAIRGRLATGEPCRVIATSLIEAGVDLSFRRAWRAEAGLDQIIQVAGRVNRHGEYPLGDSLVTVFEPADDKPPAEIAGLIGDLRSVMRDHPDLQSDEAVEAYFRQVYWRHQHGRSGLDARSILPRTALLKGAEVLTDFAFRSIAEDFRLIDEGLAPVIVVADVARLESRLRGPESSGSIARDLQRLVVQVPPRDRAALIAAGAVRYLAPERRGDQFAALETLSLYSTETGLDWGSAGILPVAGAIF